MAKKRYCFTVDESEGIRFEEFAAMRAAPVGSLAIVAIREYIDRKQADRQRADNRRKVTGVDRGGANATGQVAGSPEGIPEGGRDVL